MIALDFEIVARLQIQPKAIAGAKIPSEPQGGVGSDRARTMNDLVDAAGRDADIVREPILREAERLEKSAARISPGWIGVSLRAAI